jgi:hypothetical protein
MLLNEKRLHADTAIQTTHFLKKCAMSSQHESVGAFTRGALTFEDYNYSMYNPYILLENSQ